MILAALNAELFKLRRNRTVLAWAFLFAPAMTLVIGIGQEVLTRLAPLGAELLRVAPLDYVLRAANASGNLIVDMFLILGGAVMFGGEYRWETWRAIVPRVGRSSLLISKALAFGLAGTCSMLACALAGFLVALFGAATNHTGLIWPPVGAPVAFLAVAISIIGACLQVWLIGLLCAVAAIATRSILATSLIVFLALIAQEIAVARVTLADASPVFAIVPTLASRGAQGWASALLADADAIGEQLGPFGLIATSVWIVLLLSVAHAMFTRQDLARE